MKNSRIFILFFILSTISGCAFGTRHVQLHYPPEEQTSGIAEASVDHQGSGRAIILAPFQDTRNRGEIVGHVQNGFGMKTADVKTSNNVSEWVTKAIAMELEKQGYKVKIVSTKPELSSDMVVSGNISNVYCTAYLSYEGEVSLLAKIEKDGKKLLEKPYLGRNGSGANWAASSKSFEKTLSLSLQEAINGFIADIYTTEQKIKSGSVSETQK